MFRVEKVSQIPQYCKDLSAKFEEQKPFEERYFIEVLDNRWVIERKYATTFLGGADEPIEKRIAREIEKLKSQAEEIYIRETKNLNIQIKVLDNKQVPFEEKCTTMTSKVMLLDSVDARLTDLFNSNARTLCPKKNIWFIGAPGPKKIVPNKRELTLWLSSDLPTCTIEELGNVYEMVLEKLRKGWKKVAKQDKEKIHDFIIMEYLRYLAYSYPLFKEYLQYLADNRLSPLSLLLEEKMEYLGYLADSYPLFKEYLQYFAKKHLFPQSLIQEEKTVFEELQKEIRNFLAEKHLSPQSPTKKEKTDKMIEALLTDTAFKAYLKGTDLSHQSLVLEERTVFDALQRHFRDFLTDKHVSPRSPTKKEKTDKMIEALLTGTAFRAYLKDFDMFIKEPLLTEEEELIDCLASKFEMNDSIRCFSEWNDLEKDRDKPVKIYLWMKKSDLDKFQRIFDFKHKDLSKKSSDGELKEDAKGSSMSAIPISRSPRSQVIKQARKSWGPTIGSKTSPPLLEDEQRSSMSAIPTRRPKRSPVLQPSRNSWGQINVSKTSPVLLKEEPVDASIASPLMSSHRRSAGLGDLSKRSPVMSAHRKSGEPQSKK